MRHNTLKNQTVSVPHFSIASDNVDTHMHTAQLVDAAWNFAYTSLWNNTQFSTKEADAAKEKSLNISHWQKKAAKPLYRFANGCCLPAIM